MKIEVRLSRDVLYLFFFDSWYVESQWRGESTGAVVKAAHLLPFVKSISFDNHVHQYYVIASGSNIQRCFPLLKLERENELEKTLHLRRCNLPCPPSICSSRRMDYWVMHPARTCSPPVNTSDVSWCRAPAFRVPGVVFQALQNLLCCYRGSACFAGATGKASCNPPTWEQPSEDQLCSAVQGILQPFAQQVCWHMKPKWFIQPH